MGFESVRGYVGLASGLSDLTLARALEAAQGLLSLPAAGIATGSKVAVRAGVLADELLAAAVANRSGLTTLVRSEVGVAITRLGLVSVQQLEEAQEEAARLRAEVVRLRSQSSKAAVAKSTAKRAPAKIAKKATKTAPVRRSAVTTRAKPAGT